MMPAHLADVSGLVASCSACGKQNRLAWSAIGQRVRCGTCHVDLPAPDAPFDVPSTEVFDAMVHGARLPVLVDFWAAWCGPCRVVAPHLAEVARRSSGHLLVAKVDTDALETVSARCSIRSIPTLAVFAQGLELQRMAGAASADDIHRFVQHATSAR